MWSMCGSDHTRFRSQINTDFDEYPLGVGGRVALIPHPSRGWTSHLG